MDERYLKRKYEIKIKNTISLQVERFEAKTFIFFYFSFYFILNKNSLFLFILFLHFPSLPFTYSFFFYPNLLLEMTKNIISNKTIKQQKFFLWIIESWKVIFRTYSLYFIFGYKSLFFDLLCKHIILLIKKYFN